MKISVNQYQYISILSINILSNEQLIKHNYNIIYSLLGWIVLLIVLYIFYKSYKHEVFVLNW